MPCHAMPALRALSHIDKGWRWGAIWHLSHCLEQCRDYGMREKHMGISARLNFFWASMVDVLVGEVYMYAAV
jgi:hypothetical protein